MVTPATVTITIRDDDERELVLSQTQVDITETDGNVTETYTVELGSQPTADVTVELMRAGANDLTTLPVVSPTILTFTPDDWNIEQTVTVTVAADEDAEDEHMTVMHDVSGGTTGRARTRR